jgi:membrane AbrB-like protein
MQPADTSRLKYRNLIESLLIGGIGGLALNAARFPAGWLAGAMLFTAVAALLGRPISVPQPLARAFFIILGISIGGVVTPETVKGLSAWPFSLFMISVAMAGVTLGTVTYLTKVHGWNTITAVFAGVPGGLSQVMALATEQKDCDVRGVAIVQTLRVVILAIGVPAVLSAFGIAGPARLPAGALGIADAPLEFALLVGGCTAAALGLLRLGFPGGLIFGPMVLSAVLHGGAFVSVTMPFWLASASMVGLGTVSGARFTGTPFRLMLRYLGAGFGAFVVSLVIAGAVGGIVTATVSLPLADVIVAYAPGSVDAMMILALALHLDPVFVGAHHLTRVFVVSLALPVLSHYFGRPRRNPGDGGAAVLPSGNRLDDRSPSQRG